jgi:hypothetical protein
MAARWPAWGGPTTVVPRGGGAEVAQEGAKPSGGGPGRPSGGRRGLGAAPSWMEVSQGDREGRRGVVGGRWHRPGDGGRSASRGGGGRVKRRDGQANVGTTCRVDGGRPRAPVGWRVPGVRRATMA